MREVKIRKRSGSYRTVVCPERSEKRALRQLLPQLSAVAMALDVHGVQHGFVTGRSPVTNAKKHIGYAFSLCCDLSDCFDNIKIKQMKGLEQAVPSACFYQGVARQGLPTSPAVCNIALALMDSEIIQALGGRGVYTRYADDLTISSNSREVVGEMLEKITQIVKNHGQQLATHKTKILFSKAGRRNITGVAVSDTGIHPTRKIKRRLRAAKHQNHQAQKRGLEEWCLLRPPNWMKLAMRLVDEAKNTHPKRKYYWKKYRHQLLREHRESLFRAIVASNK